MTIQHSAAHQHMSTTCRVRRSAHHAPTRRPLCLPYSARGSAFPFALATRALECLRSEVPASSVLAPPTLPRWQRPVARRRPARWRSHNPQPNRGAFHFLVHDDRLSTRRCRQTNPSASYGEPSNGAGRRLGRGRNDARREQRDRFGFQLRPHLAHDELPGSPVRKAGLSS